jgi:hypothetical protein
VSSRVEIGGFVVDGDEVAVDAVRGGILESALGISMLQIRALGSHTGTPIFDLATY